MFVVLHTADRCVKTTLRNAAGHNEMTKGDVRALCTREGKSGNMQQIRIGQNKIRVNRMDKNRTLRNIVINK